MPRWRWIWPVVLAAAAVGSALYAWHASTTHMHTQADLYIGIAACGMLVLALGGIIWTLGVIHSRRMSAMAKPSHYANVARTWQHSAWSGTEMVRVKVSDPQYSQAELDAMDEERCRHWRAVAILSRLVTMILAACGGAVVARVLAGILHTSLH